MGSDFWLVVRFWVTLFLFGAAAYPITKRLFSSWWDKGYFFSKAVGIGLVTYIVYVAGTMHVLAFTTPTILFVLVAVASIGLTSMISLRTENGELRIKFRSAKWSISKHDCIVLICEEVIFFLALLLWSWVKGHEASIRALEKFMDYGFTSTILNSSYFPVPDMWYAGFSINYYYFGHIVMAILTKLSGIELAYTFNLMLAAVFAFTATMSFSIGYQLIAISHPLSDRLKADGWKLRALCAGLLTSFLVTLAGNMQTLYAFTKGYTGEDVKPFWELFWPVTEFFSKLPEGLERYWYANATRFIPFTIHEFPSYSFAVSDMHGHVLSLPFTLLAIAIILAMFAMPEIQASASTAKTTDKKESENSSIFSSYSHFSTYVFYGVLLAILLMTNALDGPIYFGLFIVLMGLQWYRAKKRNDQWKPYAIKGALVFFGWIAASIPFLSHFKSFVTGLAVNCPPGFLASKIPDAQNKIGPFIFEEVTKCQHSPFWMWWLLWGFFVFCGIWLIIKRFVIFDLRFTNKIDHIKFYVSKIPKHERVLFIFFVFSLLLVIFPEFFYFKDIYPAHFRSNTMFKLGYQAFILFSIVSGYAIVTLLKGTSVDPDMKSQSADWRTKFQILNTKLEARNSASPAGRSKLQILSFLFSKKVFLILLIPQLFLVSIYPIFSVRSYYGALREYQGLFGLNWMITEYPDDYKAIEWFAGEQKSIVSKRKMTISDKDCSDKPVVGTNFSLPVLLEADGDSYTDYNRFSAFAGLPTAVGWAVHEWLWRGCYDVVAPRREDVRTVYESTDAEAVAELLKKYHVSYIVIGKLEREKFTQLNEKLLESLGSVGFVSNGTSIIKIVQAN